MYNRASEFMKAREHAERAIERYRKTRTRSGEAQALLCLADALRTGTDEQRQQATRHATAALDIFREERLEYNVPRAYNYLATLAGLRNDRAAAANYGEQALAAARKVGNQTLEALVSMNLGATYTYLDRARAVDNYQQSYRLYESLGDQSRAAEVQANRGALLIVFGSNPDEGLREVQNALAVSRRLGNKDFEAFCLQLIALYEQRVGRFAEADRALNQTLAIGRERDLSDKVLSATRNLARSRFALADYEKARELLNSVIAAAADAGTRIEAVIQLGRIDIRMGDFAAAQRSLEEVSEEGARDAGLAPLLYPARGELQYESGRLPAASTEFAKAAAAASGDFADPAAIESQAYLGLIEASSGNIPSGRRTLENALARASRHFTVEARCRLFLARVEVLSREPEGALRTLNEIDEDDDTHTIGPELRAQVHYWKALAMVNGDRTAADAEQRAARTILSRVIDAMPPAYRKSIASRPDIAKIVG
jgi:tetratricopeptide (TPR) repeat protein